MTLCFHRMVSCMAALGAAVLGSTQQPFALDTTFHTEFTSWYVSSILPLEDGKVIASGVMKWPGELSEKRLVRLLSNGGRDEIFYNSGLGGGKIVPWKGDTFYVAATQTVRRILPTGYQDPSFIGMNTGPYFSSLQGGDYHVFPDGRVVMSGYHNLSDSIRGFMGYHNFIWFSNEGYLDTTRVHRTGNGVIFNFRELPDGKFICTGTGTQQEGSAVDKIFRLYADGSVDTTFQSGVTEGRAFSYLPQEDGKVLVAGSFVSDQAPGETLWVARFLEDGTLDPTFSRPQFSLGALPDPGDQGPRISSLTPFEDGSIFVQGTFQFVNGQPRRGICLIDADGELLWHFDSAGVDPYYYQCLPYASTRGIVPYGEDHYLIWGAYHGYDDGTISDPQQRFITRLHKGELHVGVQETSPEPARLLRLHPNPTNNWVAITYDLHGKADEGSLIIKDAVGHTVSSQPITNEKGQLVIDTRAFGAGMYTVQLSNAGQVIHLEKLVVQ